MSTHTTQATKRGWVPNDTLANRLVLVRRSLGLNQRQAADRCGLTFGAWQGMEDGRQVRSLDVKVAKISAALGVDRDWLLWGGPLVAESDRVLTLEETEQSGTPENATHGTSGVYRGKLTSTFGPTWAPQSPRTTTVSPTWPRPLPIGPRPLPGWGSHTPPDQPNPADLAA